MPKMLEDFLYLVLCIVFYQYWIWYQALAMVSYEQYQIEYGMYFHPWWQLQLSSIASDYP